MGEEGTESEVHKFAGNKFEQYREAVLARRAQGRMPAVNPLAPTNSEKIRSFTGTEGRIFSGWAKKEPNLRFTTSPGAMSNSTV